jgi:cytochrome P450
MPAGIQLLLSPWVVHRDERWFPEPERFRPERWLDGSTSELPRFAYFPFGGGPRVCIGAGFATLEAVLVLATVASRFRLEPVGPRPEPWPALTLRPRDGVRVRVVPRV